MNAIAQKLRRPIVLVGFMGAGKSTAGRRLAGRLAIPFLDLDQLIEAEIGTSIPDLFTHEGEPAFRRRESVALDQALATLAGGGVLAGGGGLFADPANRARLAAARALVVWLDVPLDEITRRIGDIGSRPLFRDPAAVDRLYRERNVLYATAEVRVDASGPDLERVVDRLFAAVQKHAGAVPPVG